MPEDKRIENLIKLSEIIDKSIAETTKPAPATIPRPLPRPLPRGTRR